MKKKKQNFLFILLIAMVFHHFIWLFQEPFILSHIVPTIINLNTNTHNQTKKNDTDEDNMPELFNFFLLFISLHTQL